MTLDTGDEYSTLSIDDGSANVLPLEALTAIDAAVERAAATERPLVVVAGAQETAASLVRFDGSTFAATKARVHGPVLERLRTAIGADDADWRERFGIDRDG